MCPFFMLKFFKTFFILLLAFQSKATITFELNPQIIKTYELGVSFNIIGMEEQLNQLNKSQNSNGFVLLLENYKDCIQLLIEEDTHQYKSSLGARQNRLERLRLADKTSPFYYYSLTECYIQWSFIRLRFNDKVHAANDLRKAVSYLTEGKKRFPKFYLFLKPQAIISAMASAIPPNFKWLAEMVGVKGNINDSSNQLDSLERIIHHSNSFIFFEPEIKFIKIFIGQNLQQKQVIDLMKLTKKSHPLITFGSIWSAAKNQKSPFVISHIPLLKSKIKGLDFFYLDYLLAEAKLNQLEDPTVELENFISKSKGTSFLKSAYRRLSWYRIVKNDTLNYLNFKSKILKIGTDFTDDDKQAMEEALSNEIPNIGLLKARLLFDGGDYKRSLIQLSENSISAMTLEMKVESYYRKARCFQQLNQLDESIENFIRTIAIGERLPIYFAAASAYQLGIIYKQKGESQISMNYFKKVSRFPNHAYKTSLDMKAAAELSN
jgi:tetratricopeptide (TPR) repeat protein